MSKFSKIQWGDNKGAYSFQCPGCKCAHMVLTDTNKKPCWSFNNDLDSPTLSPSIRVKGQKLCHSFIKDGKIQFLNDCTHELSGKTVEIPEWE